MVTSKWKDLAERAGWTFVQAYISLGLFDWLAKGIDLNLVHQLYISLGAAIVATIKVVIAQRLGPTDSGSLPDTTKK